MSIAPTRSGNWCMEITAGITLPGPGRHPRTSLAYPPISRCSTWRPFPVSGSTLPIVTITTSITLVQCQKDLPAINQKNHHVKAHTLHSDRGLYHTVLAAFLPEGIRLYSRPPGCA